MRSKPEYISSRIMSVSQDNQFIIAVFVKFGLQKSRRWRESLSYRCRRNFAEILNGSGSKEEGELQLTFGKTFGKFSERVGFADDA